MNRSWTGKIQVTLLFVYISWKKGYTHNVKASSEEVIVMRFFNFEGYWLNEHLSITTSRSYTKCLKIASFILTNCQFCLIKPCNLYIKKVVTQRCSMKNIFWKASQYSEVNTRSSHPEVFYQKLAREYLTAFAGKNLPSSPF